MSVMLQFEIPNLPFWRENVIDYISSYNYVSFSLCLTRYAHIQNIF